MKFVNYKNLLHVLAFGLIFSIIPSTSWTDDCLPNVCMTDSSTKHMTIVGGGIAAAFQAYFAHLDAKKQGICLRVDIFEKNKALADTTAMNVMPSLTPDEILSVVPRGKELMRASQILFSEPGGIRVDDAPGIHNSPTSNRFVEQADIYSQDDAGHKDRTQTLLALGKMSMDLWQNIYDNADEEFRSILVAANFNPCREQRNVGFKALHDGYRIDLIYNVKNAMDRAKAMKADYEGIGYNNCEILSPEQVAVLDPFVASFCRAHSSVDENGQHQWHNDSAALWRPGGCIDAQVLLPKLYDYLKKTMGTYVDQDGQVKDCFQLYFDKNVQEVKFDTTDKGVTVTGLRFADGSELNDKDSLYVFCPGEAVGTLNKFGFKEPAYARFAGASLMFNIPIPADMVQECSSFSHCMEVHQVGVVLAWQARFREGKIFIGVAGTKAYYADQAPDKNQAFAKNRNLLQLNMVNNVLPQFMSLAFGRDTTGETLTQVDLDYLEAKGIVKRWVGTRAVAYDGFPTLGSVYLADGSKVNNAIVNTHLGSGGGSFAPAAVVVSSSVCADSAEQDLLVSTVLKYSQSTRVAGE